MKVTKYLLGLMCTTTNINNGNRNRLPVAKFGPLDPIVTFFHSADVIYLWNCYFRVQKGFGQLKKICGEKYFHGKEHKKICAPRSHKPYYNCVEP